MKRNIIFSGISILASVFLVGGCYSLDLYPDNQLSDGTFWQTPDQAKAAVVGVYSILPDKNVCGELYLEDALGSIGACTDHPICDLITGDCTSSNEFVLAKWTALYEGIARANLVIKHLPEMTSISDDVKTQYIGEARFLRAFFYNMLLNYWGAVPYYDETCIIGEQFSDMKEPRMSVEALRRKITDDLDFAISSLPEDWPAEEFGRATSGAAKALKAKVLLYAKQYYDAALLFEEVVKSGNYSLDTSYSNIFKPGYDAGNEMIFTVQNLSVCENLGNGSSYGEGQNKFTLAPEFVDTYRYSSGLEFDWDYWFDGFTTDNEVKKSTFLLRNDSTCEDPEYPKGYYKLKFSYRSRDPRMALTAILPYSTYIGWDDGQQRTLEYLIPSTGTGDASNGSINVVNEKKAYLMRKFVPEGDADGINFPIIRYADVLLMYAECLNEIDFTSTAVGYVNLVRERAGMATVLSLFTSKEDLTELIRYERAAELAGEGHNYMDLKRWGLLKDLDGKAVTDLIGEIQYVRKVSDRDTLFPIPASEIKLNPALTQNPGW